MTQQRDPFAPTVAKAQHWLDVLTDTLGTEDRFFAYRALRAWCHTVRDRIPVPVAAHLGAQMPELIRGMFYDGWVPSHVPVRHGTEAFVSQFAREAGIPRADVPTTAGLVTDALDQLFSPGQLERVFAVFPESLVHVVWGQPLADNSLGGPIPSGAWTFSE